MNDERARLHAHADAHLAMRRLETLRKRGFTVRLRGQAGVAEWACDVYDPIVITVDEALTPEAAVNAAWRRYAHETAAVPEAVEDAV